MTTPTATIFVPYHALNEVIQSGPRALQPAAGAVVPGTLYSVTDEGNRLERSDGAVWALYAPLAGGGGGAPAPHAATHADGGTDEVTLTQAQVTGLTSALAAKVEDTDPRLTNARTPTAHALTHAAGGSDPVSVKTLAGFPGPLPKVYLSGDGTFDPLPGVAAHHATHEPGGSDALANVAWTTASNTFTQDQTLQKTLPRLGFVDLNEPANARLFRLASGGQSLAVFALSDDGTVVQTRPLACSRGGDVVIGRYLYEQTRPAALGHWTDVPFAAGNFSAGGGGAWTVQAGDVVTNRYTQIGQTLLWTLRIQTSTVSGTVTALVLILPGSLVAATIGTGVATLLNVGAPANRGDIVVQPGTTYLTITRTDGGALLPVSEAGYVFFTLCSEVL